MKKAIITTSILALFSGAVIAAEYDVVLQSMSNVTISNPDNTQGIVAGKYSGKSVSMSDVKYNDISVTVDYDDNSITTQLHGGITRISKGTLTVEDSTFKNINMHSQYQVQGGAIYVNDVGAKAVITGSTFDSITSSVGDYTPSSALPFAMGSAIINYRGDLSVSDTDFNNNKVVANKAEHSAEGGAIYLMMTGKPDTHHTEGEKVSFTNVKFTNNSAVSVANNNEHSAGGAIIVQGRYDGVYDSTRSLTFTDTVFQNNQAGWGGAIYSDTQSMTFNVSAGKELAYTGNKSLDGDNAGGFIYMDVHSPDGGATYKDVFATFNIAENAKLTIGDGTVGYDSIASSNNHATINKTGAGSLVVNSSMEYFTGSLNVEAGKMEANNGLGAKAITIANGATLGLQINGNNTLSNSSLVFTNNGTLVLTSKVGLASGDYTVSATEIADYGVTKTYGGVLVGNIFTVAESQKVEVGAEVSTVVENNGIVEITTNENTSVSMAFNAESATVNKVVEATETLVESIGADFVQMGAYEFDVSMEEGDTVVLSFYVGDSTLKASDFSIFHKSEGGQWGKAEDVSGISYDGEYLSFVVSHFSSYGYAAVPEPSTYAAIFGALALAFVIYRRRK